MQKRLLTILMCMIAISLSSFAAPKKPAAKKASSAGPLPDKAYIQKIWDGWATIDPANVAPYYAKGPNTFFDIAPLKYTSWEDYAEGVKKEFATYKSAILTVNDDLQIHPAGDYCWVTATIKEDAALKSGKREMATFRWTAVFQKQDGKWLIVHEHVSEPVQ